MSHDKNEHLVKRTRKNSSGMPENGRKRTRLQFRYEQVAVLNLINKGP